MRIEDYNFDDEDESDDLGPTRKVILWHIRSTDKAHLFTTLPISHPDHKEVWIPRSQIKHVSYDPAKPGEQRRAIVEATEWILEKKGL